MIKYNGKNLTQLLDLVIAAKEIPTPTRKEATETVPYMSGEWDFSFLDGVDYYEPLILKYSFDFIGDTKREMNDLRAQAVKLFTERGDGKFYDTDISDTAYFKVYRVQPIWGGEEGLQGLLSFEIKCYPFMINEVTESFNASSTAKTLTLLNSENYRPSKVSITTSGTITVKHLEYKNNYASAGAYSVTAGTHTDALTISALDRLQITGSGSVTITVAGELIF